MRKVKKSGTILFILATFLLFFPLVLAIEPFDSATNYYRMNDTTGDDIFDNVNGFNGTPSGIVYDAIGKINNAISYTSLASNRYFPSVNYTSTWNVVNNMNFTWNIWVNHTVNDANQTIMSSIGDQIGNPRWIYLEINENGHINSSIRHSIGATQRFWSDVNLSDGGFHMVTLRANTSTVNLFIDSQLQSRQLTAAYTPISSFDNNNSFFGIFFKQENFVRTNGAYNGQMDNAGIWNRSLTNDEIKLLFNGGEGIAFSLAPILVLNETFTQPTFETSPETFTINISLDSSLYSAVQANLRYNNSLTSGSTSQSSNNRIYSSSLITPSVDLDSNISFHWEFELTNLSGDSIFFNSSDNNQTVQDLQVDDCSTNTILLLNLTVVDEETQVAFLSGSDDNVTVEVDLSLNNGISFNQTFTETNSVLICISDPLVDNTRLDALIRYEAFDHVSEFVNLQNFTVSSSNIPQNITLFDLAILDSQEFRVTFKDNNFLPVDNAIIDLTRLYIGEGVFKSVEAPLTDSFGQTIIHMQLTDVIYTIVVKKEGVILGTFEDIQAICSDLTIGECEINLNSFLTSRDFGDFFSASGLLFTIDYDEVTRIASSLFSTTDGSTALIALNVTELTGNSTVINVCNSQLTSSSGVLSCVVPASFDNTTIAITISKNGAFVGQAFFSISGQTPEDIFGQSGFIILLIMIIMLPLMVVVERVAVVIFAVIGFVLAAGLGIYSGGSVIGWGSSIMWLIIASAILIWKIGGVKK